MSLVWGREPVIETPKPESGFWLWCDECAGTGEVEREGREGVHEEITCPACGGSGGRFEAVGSCPSCGSDEPEENTFCPSTPDKCDGCETCEDDYHKSEGPQPATATAPKENSDDAGR